MNVCGLWSDWGGGAAARTGGAAGPTAGSGNATIGGVAGAAGYCQSRCWLTADRRALLEPNLLLSAL